MDYINKILCGNDLEILPKLPAELFNCCVCSPPYWSLRDYGIEPVIWDGDKDCKHEWGNKTTTLKHKSGETNPGKESWFKDKGASNDKGNCFCVKCNAWFGSLGLEPTFDLYIKHLCDIFDEAKRVLRKDGTCFVNIGDSYWGGGQGGADYGGKEIVPESNFGHVAKGKNYLSKSLCDIPYRFSIEMTNRGWIKRNTIIWHKPNCMPSSAPDRFTVDFEYLFFFTKNNKAIFWTNEKTLECISKKPLGIKGIEGEDWELRKCPKCLGTGFDQKWKVKDKDWAKIKNLHGECEKQGRRIQVGLRNKIPEKQKEICPRCKGLKSVRYSFWTGHDYWFEQQFEELKEETKKDKRTVNGYKNIRGRSWDKDPNSMFGKMGSMKVNPQGRNKRCVWIIPAQPFPEAHFAVYPEELIEIPIKAGCPEFVCKKCGKARVKIYEKGKLINTSHTNQSFYKKRGGKYGNEESYASGWVKGKMIPGWQWEQKFKGYSDCGCNAGWESGITLDPFMGSGTSALVALKQRKRFIGIEIKQEYVDMSYRKIAKVQQNIF